MRKHHEFLLRNKGQALLEMLAGMIALAVAFLSIFVIADLCRARMTAILDARKTVGTPALEGMIVGSPSLYGNADSVTSLKSQVLNVSEDPIVYSKYHPSTYPYVLKNMVDPLNNPSATMISAFDLSQSVQTELVTNNTFLAGINVGPKQITITEEACLPIMQKFP